MRAHGRHPRWASNRDRLASDAVGRKRGRLAFSGGATWVILTLGVVGCTTGRLDYHAVPSRTAFESLEPGVTTRSEVLRRLGPPEEMRRLSNFDRSLDSSPQVRRALEGADLFGREAFTYARSQRRIERFSIPPFGPSFFSFSQRHSHEERWRIEFDDADRVVSVSHVDEIGAPR